MDRSFVGMEEDINRRMEKSLIEKLEIEREGTKEG